MKQWIDWFKTPPSWRVLRIGNAALAVAMTACAVIVDDRWVAIVDAGIAGLNIAGIFHATSMIRIMTSFDKLKDAFDHMSEINYALINNKVEFFLGEAADGDVPPIAPKLH